MAWRLAGSLVVLRNQIDAMAPNRSRASDGTIGDASHASRCSRHNPNGANVVTALDITHDPARGCDIHAIADHIRRHPHPELSYVISAGRIAGRTTGWAWHAYTGSNPHNVHVHFGVGEGSDCNPQPPYDGPQPWNIDAAPPEEDDMPYTPDQIKAMVREVVAAELEKRDGSAPWRIVTHDWKPGMPVYHTDFGGYIHEVQRDQGLDQFIQVTDRLGQEDPNAVRVPQSVIDDLFAHIHHTKPDGSPLD